MSRRSRIFVLGVAALALVTLAGCKAEGTPEPSPNAVSSTALIESPKKFDGGEVTFEGEAIGEAMMRGSHAWLHLNDDAYYVKNVEEGAHLGGYNTGMPVYLASRDAARVKTFGDYKHEGDIVRVHGVYHAACAEHGGDMDIHASSLEVITPGHKVVDPVSPAKVRWAIVLVAIALALYVADRRLRFTPVRSRG